MNQSELDAICVDSQKRGKTSVLITFGSYFWLVKKIARDFYCQTTSTENFKYECNSGWNLESDSVYRT